VGISKLKLLGDSDLLDHESGAPNWATIIDPAVETRGEGVAITSAGDIVIAFNAGSPLPSLPALRGSSSYVVFLDQDTGELTAGFGYGDTETPSWTNPLAIAVMLGGDVVVAGQYNSAPLRIGDTDLPWFARQNGYAARFSRAGTARWAMAISTDTNEQLFAVEVGPSGAIFIGGWHDGGTTVGDFEIESASQGSLLARLNPDNGEVVWATGHGPSSTTRFGLRRFLIDDDELIHFASSTSTSAATRFGTNASRVSTAGFDIRMSLVDGASGALVRERIISIGGPTILSNNFALLGTEGAAIAGGFDSSGTLLGIPFGNSGRTGYDHYVMRVARLSAPETALPDPPYPIRLTRSALPDPPYPIRLTRSALPDPPYRIRLTRSGENRISGSAR
jgi:hypothetical protein